MADISKTLKELDVLVDNQDVEPLRIAELTSLSEQINNLLPKLQKLSEQCEEQSKVIKNYTNWDSLPKELKEKCLEAADYETSLKIRRCGSNEMEIVDKVRMKTKTQFRKLSFSNNFDFIVEGGATPLIRMWGNKHPIADKIESLGYILKTIQCQEFSYSQDSKKQRAGILDALHDKLQKAAPFNFRSLRFQLSQDVRVVTWLLENNGVKPVNVLILVQSKALEEEVLSLTEIFKLNTYIELNGSVGPSNFVPQVIQKWIDHDSPVGSSVRTPSSAICGTQIAEAFGDRMIVVRSGTFTIRMNTDDKIIVWTEAFWFSHCKVVSAPFN